MASRNCRACYKVRLKLCLWTMSEAMTAERAKSGIEEAVDKLGSQSALARELGIKPQAVQQWVVKGYAPADRLVEIEALTGIHRERLCDPRIADLFSDRI